MGDAFFVALTFLLYVFYTQNKMSLIMLTVFYVLILGFSTPAAFFIGGGLAAEFLAAVFAKDKKRALYIVISGVSIIAVFCLYYWYWMLPGVGVMDEFWNKSPDKSAFDAFFIVLVVLLYFLYTRSKLPLAILTVFYALISFFCPPAVMFMGGVLAGELLAAVFAWNRNRLISTLVSIVFIGLAFVLYYIERTSFVREAMSNFWNNTQGKEQLISAVGGIFLSFPFKGYDTSLIWLLVPFALLGIYSLVKQKSKIAYSVIMSMLLVSFASSIGKWPINARLWLFLPAVVLIFSAVGYDFISKGGNIVVRRVVFCLFAAITVYYAVYDVNMFKDGVYRGNQEVNPLIQYVKEHIKDGEKLYVYPMAVPTFKFKNGYTTKRIGRVNEDNVIYGVSREEWVESKVGAELDTIIKSRKAYLLFQHYWSGLDPGLAVLRQHGTVTLILNHHETPLFYFEAAE